MHEKTEKKYPAKQGSTAFGILAILTVIFFTTAVVLQVLEYLHYNG